MDIKYVIEVWSPEDKKYYPMWAGSNFEQAEKTYDKKYYLRHRRRMVKVSREVLYSDKANERS